MKLTKKTLKEVIKEVKKERQKNTMILSEMSSISKYDKIVAALEGQTAEINTVGIMSAQNPMAQAVSGPEDVIVFTMYMREDPANPYAPDPGSRQVERVQKHDEMASATDYSFEPESGQRFGLNFYGPEVQ